MGTECYECGRCSIGNEPPRKPNAGEVCEWAKRPTTTLGDLLVDFDKPRKDDEMSNNRKIQINITNGIGIPIIYKIDVARVCPTEVLDGGVAYAVQLVEDILNGRTVQFIVESEEHPNTYECEYALDVMEWYQRWG